MNEKHTEYKLIGMAAADVLKNYGSTMVLVDTNGMCTALIDVTKTGECVVKNTVQAAACPDFCQAAADGLGMTDADEVFALCSKEKNSFKRYLKTGGISDEPLKDEICCSSFLRIYENGYKQSIEQLAQAAQEMSSDDARVVLVGRLAAFYPAEHTVRAALSPMPFLPIERLCVNDSLCVANDTLVKNGQAVGERIESENKRIGHNITLRYKIREGTELVDGLLILAKKGDSFDAFRTPEYSESIIAFATDPIIIQADSTAHRLAFPRTLFSATTPLAKVQIAFGIENDVPKLLFRSDTAQASLDIDKKIYSEEE